MLLRDYCNSTVDLFFDLICLITQCGGVDVAVTRKVVIRNLSHNFLRCDAMQFRMLDSMASLSEKVVVLIVL
jgi:hypothetical protein